MGVRDFGSTASDLNIRIESRWVGASNIKALLKIPGMPVCSLFSVCSWRCGVLVVKAPTP